MNIVPRYRSSHLEVGGCEYGFGFCCGISSYSKEKQFYLGHYRTNGKINPFHSFQGFLFGGRLCKILCQGDSEVTWGSFVDYFESGTHFTSHFWKSLKKGLGTKVKHSTTFHPQTDRKAETTIQTLEDMMSACVIDFKGNWDNHLQVIVFADNNR